MFKWYYLYFYYSTNDVPFAFNALKIKGLVGPALVAEVYELKGLKRSSPSQGLPEGQTDSEPVWVWS